nr:immunoglobulin light chain junction region [Homo sapiens]
LHAKYPTRL